MLFGKLLVGKLFINHFEQLRSRTALIDTLYQVSSAALTGLSTAKKVFSCNTPNTRSASSSFRRRKESMSCNERGNNSMARLILIISSNLVAKASWCPRTYKRSGVCSSEQERGGTSEVVELLSEFRFGGDGVVGEIASKFGERVYWGGLGRDAMSERTNCICWISFFGCHVELVMEQQQAKPAICPLLLCRRCSRGSSSFMLLLISLLFYFGGRVVVVDDGSGLFIVSFFRVQLGSY